MRRIFEPFAQGESFLTRRQPGTGLGLALGRLFVRLLGGDIEAESTPGKGSTFMLRLPARFPRMDAGTPPPGEADSTIPSSAPATGGGTTG